MEETKIIETEELNEEIDATLAQLGEVAVVGGDYCEKKERADALSDTTTSMTKSLTGPSDFIYDRVSKYESVKDLMEAVKDRKALLDFFTNPETGEVVYEVSEEDEADPKERRKDDSFRRSYLAYLKESQLAEEELNRTMSDFESAQKELFEGLGYASKDFVSNYMKLIRDKRKEAEDHHEDPNSPMMQEIRYVESGFNFNVMIESILSHKTIPQHTVEDMHDADRVHSFGRRYHTALKNADTLASLITIINKTKEHSFEEMYLSPDQYKKEYDNYFLFSLVRSFAMMYWTPRVKRMHSIMVVIMQKFIDGEMDEPVKQEYLDNIVHYLEATYPKK